MSEYRDLPQLIVALDGIEDNANYIFVTDVKKDIDYYCPCCRKPVKPCSYREDNIYQAHFRHETGGCSEETYIHYICKNWLLADGCKFIVNKTEYVVENIEVEKVLNTSFGKYKPDIIVNTAIGKTFYFEIKSTNKKDESYIPKWDELGNDVVEVDIKYFVNKKFKNNIPVFNLIYSEGNCFIKKYISQDYNDFILKRKLEWKRQDKLNYKIQWEKLDWFWLDVQCYKNGEKSLDDVLKSFKQLDLFDKELCFDLLKKQSCIKSNNPSFREILNQDSLDYIDKWKVENNDLLSQLVEEKYFSYDLYEQVEGICLNFQPRKYFWIEFRYKHKSPYKSRLKFENREWIVRPTIVKRMLAEIKDSLLKTQKYEIKKEKYLGFVRKSLKDIDKKFEFDDCIWKFQWHDRQDGDIDLEMRLKEIKSYKWLNKYISKKTLCFYDVFLSDMEITYENVYEYLLKHISRCMRNTRDEVIKKDGINSSKRLMFVKKEGVEYGK